MTIKPVFAWYDLWVGLYWDRKARKLYFLPLPMLGVVISFGSASLPEADHAAELSCVMREFKQVDDALREHNCGRSWCPHYDIGCEEAGRLLDRKDWLEDRAVVLANLIHAEDDFYQMQGDEWDEDYDE